MKLSPVIVPGEEEQGDIGSSIPGFKSASHVLVVELTIGLFYYYLLHFLYMSCVFLSSLQMFSSGIK